MRLNAELSPREGEIANFKKWAYSFGLDVSRLDPLRTAGDRAGLNAEVKRLQEERLNRMSEWLAARNEVDDFADKAASHILLISRFLPS